MFCGSAGSPFSADTTVLSVIWHGTELMRDHDCCRLYVGLQRTCLIRNEIKGATVVRTKQGSTKKEQRTTADPTLVVPSS